MHSTNQSTRQRPVGFSVTDGDGVLHGRAAAVTEVAERREASSFDSQIQHRPDTYRFLAEGAALIRLPRQLPLNTANYRTGCLHLHLTGHVFSAPIHPALPSRFSHCVHTLAWSRLHEGTGAGEGRGGADTGMSALSNVRRTIEWQN